MSEFSRVTGLEWHSPGVFELQLERGGVNFVPGDCMALYAEDGKTSRPYSVASGLDEDILRFVVRRMPGGVVSPYLADRRPGDTVRVSPPFGWFRPGRPPQPAPFVFIATGTGISPFLSHFRSRPEAPPLQCLYGVRTLKDAVDYEWVRTMCPLKVAVSRERAKGHHHGRVTDFLDDMPVAPDIHYYLCGLDAMIDEVTRWLEENEVEITHIHRECFFNASYTA
jgi:ferredoxin--NADP+ reductase